MLAIRGGVCAAGRVGSAAATAGAAGNAAARQGRRQLQTGIVGLPNVGKSTLFNALVGSAAAAASNFPFCTIEPNHGKVPVPDVILDALGAAFKSKRVVPTTLEFVDIAGLIKGASSGAGLGNKFLSTIRQVDCIVEVVRCFPDVDVTHVEGSVDVLRDIDVIDTELALADLTMLEKAIGKSKRPVGEAEVVAKAIEHLSGGNWVKSLDLSAAERDFLQPYPLLTNKPVIYAANVAEDDLADGNAMVAQVRQYAEGCGEQGIIVSAKTESEITQLSSKDRAEMLEALGVDHSAVGLVAVIQAAYARLGLITFYTVGEAETRAWTVPRGSLAPVAAGRIHSDFQKGFIRAEVAAATDLLEHGSWERCRELGLQRTEGKAYTVQEGDCIIFKTR